MPNTLKASKDTFNNKKHRISLIKTKRCSILTILLRTNTITRTTWRRLLAVAKSAQVQINLEELRVSLEVLDKIVQEWLETKGQSVTTTMRLPKMAQEGAGDQTLLVLDQVLERITLLRTLSKDMFRGTITNLLMELQL